ncbi:MAG: gamma carbonic anhydrase family protein [Faecalibacterium sp.]
MISSFCGKMPRIAGAAFVAPNATVLGDVVLEKDSSVWYGAVLRGDDGTLTIGQGSNIQDNAVLHCDAGGCVTLGRHVTVGHSAIVHGCTVGDGTLIGMHATLLNHCTVGQNCIIGAGALVPEGMVIPDGMIAVGVPARILRPVTDAQRAASEENAVHYIRAGREHAAALDGGSAGESFAP